MHQIKLPMMRFLGIFQTWLFASALINVFIVFHFKSCRLHNKRMRIAASPQSTTTEALGFTLSPYNELCWRASSAQTRTFTLIQSRVTGSLQFLTQSSHYRRGTNDAARIKVLHGDESRDARIYNTSKITDRAQHKQKLCLRLAPPGDLDLVS